MQINRKTKLLIIAISVVSVVIGLLLIITATPDFLSLSTTAFAFGCVSIIFSAVFFWYCLTHKLDDIETSPVDILYGVGVAITLLSFFFLVRKRQILVNQTYVIYATLSLYLLIRLSFKRYLYNKQVLIISFLVSIAAIEASYGLKQFLSNSQMTGHFFHVNLFAIYIALHIPLTFALLWSKSHRLPYQIVCGLVSGLLLLCVFLTRCRAAYLGLVIVLFLMFLARYGPIIKQRYLKIPKYFVYICGAICAIALFFIVRMLFYLEPSSGIGRILVWKVSLQMFSKSPFVGVGFGNFYSLYNLYQGQFFAQGMGTALERLSASAIPYAFNHYIEYAVEFGYLGLIVFVGFWFLIIKNVWAAFARFYHLRTYELKCRAQSKNLYSANIDGESMEKGSHIPPNAEEMSLTNVNLQLGIAGTVLLYMVMSIFYSTSRFAPLYSIFVVFLAWVVSANQKYRSSTRKHKKFEILESGGTDYQRIKVRRLYKIRRLFWIAFSFIALLISIILTPSFYMQHKSGRDWYTARILNNRGEYNKALELYYGLYRNLKLDERFLYDFGRLLLQMGKTKEAIGYLEQCKELWPNPFLFEDLAIAHEKLGNLTEAVKNASLASSILPWRLTSKYMLADFYYQLGDTTNAGKYVQQVLDTPMKKETLKGHELKERARILQQTLKIPLEELRTRREQAISVIPPTYRPDVIEALASAGANEIQLIDAIHVVDPEQRNALAFLLTNMPEQDLKALSTDFLVTNLHYAFKVRSAIPYNMNIPEDIFLNYVLPYANVNEHRDNWRPDFYERFIDVARNSSSIEETVKNFNTNLFHSIGVSFRGAEFPDVQSPFESMEKGHASCGGLSILLIDVCRAVGIPSRLVFIPRWVNMMFGHIWVEVYDNGQWHCLAAYDAHDPTWPCIRASETDPSKPEHRIYAVSFERTQLYGKYGPDVPLIDVTDRYINLKGSQ